MYHYTWFKFIFKQQNSSESGVSIRTPANKMDEGEPLVLEEPAPLDSLPLPVGPGYQDPKVLLEYT